METPRRNRLPFTVVLALALGLAGAVLVGGRRGPAGALARVSFDLLHVLQPAAAFDRARSPVALVYLDLESHLRLRQSPSERWDRSLHTRLIERLTEAGARAIVFDVIFDTPWPDPAVDRAFADAMRRQGRVILAAERRRTVQATDAATGFEVRGLNLPEPQLRAAARDWGAAEVAVDADFVVRESTLWVDQPEQPTLASATARALGVPTAAGWIRYYGPPLTLPHVSYRSVLEPGAIDPAFFRDRVVFVGSRPMVAAFGDRRDELRHPFSAWEGTRTFMPGVEIHATQWLNWQRADGLRRLGSPTEMLLSGAVGLVLAVGLARLRPIPGAAFAAGVAVLAWATAEAAFTRANVWVPWLAVSAVLAPGAWLVSAARQTREWVRQKRAFEARRREDAHRIEQQAALIERARDVIVVTDLDGRIRYANPSARQLLGTVGSAEPTGHPVLPVADFATARECLLRTGEWAGVTPWGGAPGAPGMRLLDSRWTLLRDAPGSVASILVIGTDVTEQRRLEAEFLRAQKWESLGSLAGGMAHDLNNTLAPALLGLQLLQKSESREDTRRTLVMIENHTRRGAETVRQVLSFLRGRGAEITELDPVALVRELEDLVRAGFPGNIRVSSLVPSRLGRVRGNATQLHQALLNLCLNARDAMPEGGELSFTLDDVDLGPEEARQWKDGRAGAFVLIAVSDTGTGIPLAHLERIFDPLFTTKQPGQGTGLGLASVLRIVRQHDGFVGVTSDVGAGTTFELYLPRIVPGSGAGAGNAG